MVENPGWGRKLYLYTNSTLLIVLALTCFFPILHVLALSFSSNTAIMRGAVTLWPVEFQTLAYEYVLNSKLFMNAMGVSMKRLLIGTTLQMIMIVTLAYPLSKESAHFRWRTLYVWVLFITLVLNGGLIPTYMTIQKLGLMDTIWAITIPNAVPVFSVVLLLNFFRGIPKELEEAAFIDGAGHVTTLFRIFLPLSLPALATLLLFSLVFHWNSWFDGIIYMNQVSHYPLQSYLHSVVIMHDPALTSVDENLTRNLSNRTLKAAQIFIGALPILIVYPFLQKYFMKGIVLGSVKG